MIDLLAIAVRLRDEAEERANWLNRDYWTLESEWHAHQATLFHNDIRTLTGIACAVQDAEEAG